MNLDFFLPLAESTNQITMSLEWLVGIATAATASLGGAARLVWNFFTNKINEQQTQFQLAISTKDTQIAAIQVQLDQARRDHSDAVERLQNVTLTKMEQFNEKVVGLVERVVEQQSETAAILRSVQVQIERGKSSESGGGRTG